MIEILRGKTIIDKIIFKYKSGQFIRDISKVEYKHIKNIALNVEEEKIVVKFKQDFVRFVSWDYFQIFYSIRKSISMPIEISLYAHTLFARQKDNFCLKFSKDGLVIRDRKNIEDTLFLDIQRYFECYKNSY